MSNQPRFRATFKLANPDAMDATTTITTSIGDWKALRSELNNTFPAWGLRDAINDLVRSAEESFETEGEVSS